MTETLTNTRVTVIDGWAVRDLPNGDQVRARLRVDECGDTMEPERDGTGVLLVRERDSYGGVSLDEHDGLEHVLEHTSEDRGGNVRVETCKPWDPSKNWQDQVTTLGIDREEFVRRYLRAFWGVEDALLFRHRDCQDWADIWVIVESVRPDGWDEDWTISREGAESVAREWSDWAKGDCYYVEIEHRSLADAMEAEDSDDMWSGFESYGDAIGDDGARCLLHDALYVHPFGGVDIASLPEPYEVTA